MVVTDQMDGLPLDPITCSGQMLPIIFKPSVAQVYFFDNYVSSVHDTRVQLS